MGEIKPLQALTNLDAYLRSAFPSPPIKKSLDLLFQIKKKEKLKSSAWAILLTQRSVLFIRLWIYNGLWKTEFYSRTLGQIIIKQAATKYYQGTWQEKENYLNMIEPTYWHNREERKP